MTVIAALLVAAAVTAYGDRSRRRLPVASDAGRGEADVSRRRLLASVACFTVAALMLVSAPLAVLALVVTCLLVLRRARPRRQPDDGSIALTFDVLAACIDAGATPSSAARASADAASAPVSAALVATAVALDRGDDPVDAWTGAEAEAPVLAPAARACRRAAMSGAAVADELRRAATASRAERVAAKRGNVQRAAVWLVLPLGLCFLPAFVLVGVAPIVVAAVPGLVR